MLEKVHDLFRLRTSPVIFFVSVGLIAAFVIRGIHLGAKALISVS
ncbi:hypothetical protein [Nesterenkonia alkaliphila]|nr:hypothetical protein [Nesterenkonia alkaliphila]